MAIRTSPSFRKPHGELSVRVQRMVFSAVYSRSLDGEVMSMRAQWGLPTLSGVVRYVYYAGQLAPRVTYLRKKILLVKWWSF